MNSISSSCLLSAKPDRRSPDCAYWRDEINRALVYLGIQLFNFFPPGFCRFSVIIQRTTEQLESEIALHFGEESQNLAKPPAQYGIRRPRSLSLILAGSRDAGNVQDRQERHLGRGPAECDSAGHSFIPLNLQGGQRGHDISISEREAI